MAVSGLLGCGVDVVPEELEVVEILVPSQFSDATGSADIVATRPIPGDDEPAPRSERRELFL